MKSQATNTNKIKVISAAGAILLAAIITAFVSFGAAAALSGANEIEQDAMALSLSSRPNAVIAGTPTISRNLSAATSLEEAADEAEAAYDEQEAAAQVEEAAPISRSLSTTLGATTPGTITIFGTTIPYVNAYGASTAPESTAGLWEGTDSVTDGSYGYFIGHHPGVFNGVMDLRAGDEVTVCDRNGDVRTYTVFKVFDVTNTTTWDQIEAEVTSHGESAILQTCVGDGYTYRIVECA